MKCFLRLCPKSSGVIIPADKIPFQYCKFVFPYLKKKVKNCWKENGFNVPLPLNSCHRLGCLFHSCMLGSLCACTTVQRQNSTYHWHSSISSKNETQWNGTRLLLVINHIIKNFWKLSNCKILIDPFTPEPSASALCGDPCLSYHLWLHQF